MARPAEAAASVSPVEGGVRVQGALTFESVPALAAQPAGWLARGGQTAVDLSGVSRADSAGMALVLEWVAQARAAGGSLRLHDAPEQMLAIARASGLASLFENDD